MKRTFNEALQDGYQEKAAHINECDTEREAHARVLGHRVGTEMARQDHEWSKRNRSKGIHKGEPHSESRQ